MSRSFVLFDAMFDLAHFLKIVSYGSVLTGLLINMYQLFVHDRQATEQLSQTQHLQVDWPIGRRHCPRNQFAHAVYL